MLPSLFEPGLVTPRKAAPITAPPARPEGPPVQSTSLTDETLRRLDTLVVVVDLDGRVVLANDKAKSLLPLDGAERSFAALWDEDGEDVAAELRRVAGSSMWLPLTLTRAGTPLPLRARAMLVGRSPVAPQINILFMHDDARGGTTEQHRALVGQLHGEIARAARAEAALRGLLQQQEVLNRELVHRVKNNLSLLLSLVRMARAKAGAGADGPLVDVEQRVLSMAAVHEILDANRETDVVRADQMIERVVAGVSSALMPEGVAIATDLAPVRLHVAEATPLSLAVNELLTNALKHAFPGGRGGTVRIGLRLLADGRCEASVADDGAGFEAGQDRRARSGSRIVASLAVQLGGSVTREAGEGTDVRVMFAPRRLA